MRPPLKTVSSDQIVQLFQKLTRGFESKVRGAKGLFFEGLFDLGEKCLLAAADGFGEQTVEIDMISEGKGGVLRHMDNPNESVCRLRHHPPYGFKRLRWRFAGYAGVSLVVLVSPLAQFPRSGLGIRVAFLIGAGRLAVGGSV